MKKNFASFFVLSIVSISMLSGVPVYAQSSDGHLAAKSLINRDGSTTSGRDLLQGGTSTDDSFVNPYTGPTPPGSLDNPSTNNFNATSLQEPGQKNFTTPTNAVICQSGVIRNVAEIFTYFTCLISTAIIPLLFSLALGFFIFGVIKYVIAKGDEKKIEDGKWYMVWGIVGLFVMVSVWGLVKIIGNTFGVENVIPLLPQS